MKRAALLGALAVVWAWTFAPAVRGGDFFVLDTARHHVPHKAAIAAAWRAGRLPEWNPDAFLGMPRIAVPAAGAWHPFNALLLLLPDAGRAETWAILLQYPVAFAGALLLGRRIGLSFEGAAVAASAYALSGFHLMTHVHPHPLTAVAALPWLLAAAWRSGRRGVGGTALVLGWIAAGGEAVVGWLAALWAAAALLSDASAPATRRIASAAAALALGAAVSAAVWLPALRAAPETNRSDGLAVEATGAFSVSSHEIFGLLVPFAFVSPDGADATGGAPFPRGSSLYPLLYLGAPVWFLALAGAARAGPKERRAALLATAAVAAGLVVALGVHAPVYRALWEAVPPLRVLRFPVKYLHVVALGLSLLAGLGADRIDPAAAGATRRAALLAVLLYAALPFALAAPGGVVRGRVLADAGPAWAHAAIAAAAAFGLALWASRRDGRGPAAAAALAVLVALDGAAAARPRVAVAPDGFYRTPPPAAAAVAGGRLYPPERDVVFLRKETADSRPAATLAEAEKWALLPQTGSLWGVRYWSGHEGFRSRRFPPLEAAIRAAPPSAQLPLLGAFGVTHVSVGPFEIRPNPFAVPRAQVPARVRYVAGDAEALDLVRAGHPIAEEALVLDSSRAGEILVFDGAAAARIVRDDPEAVDVEVRADVARLLVLADALWPGWTAAVDGRPAPIRRANAYVRAVDVPAGRHTVSFRYRAPGLRAGIAASILGLAAATLLLSWPETSRSRA